LKPREALSPDSISCLMMIFWKSCLRPETPKLCNLI
jgi:hypothetical protein